MAHAAEVYDAHVGAGLLLRGFQHGREKQFGEERVAHMVGTELDLVAFFGGAVRYRHDACVVN